MDSGATLDVSAVSKFTLGTVTAQSLSGAGAVNGNVSVGTASTIRGGLNNGGTLDTLTVNGTVNVTGSSTVGIRGRLGADLANLNAATGTFTRDLLVVNGAGNGLNFSTTGGAFDITLLNDGLLTHGGAYTITLATALNGATITNGGTTFAYLSDFTITSTRFSDFEIVSLVVDGSNLNLTFTPVPDPATVPGIGAGVLAIATVVRRRRKGMRA